jgi:hypothetical protein
MSTVADSFLLVGAPSLAPILFTDKNMLPTSLRMALNSIPIHHPYNCNMGDLTEYEILL